jgi:hypothetical protein
MPHGSGIATCFTPVLTSRRPSNHQGPAQRRLRDDARRGDVTMGIDRYGAQPRGVIVYAVQSAQKINHLAHSKSRARTQYPTSRAPLTQRADTLTSPGRRFLPFLGLNQWQGGYSIIFYTV